MRGLGIDLGTANTVVCHAKRGIIMNQPSVMTLRLDGQREPQLMAVGDNARALLGRTPVDMRVVKPVRDGVVTDVESARTYLRAILRGVGVHPWERVRFRAAIGVPLGSTHLERAALLDAAGEARMDRTVLVPEPIAGAIGCGIDPLEAYTYMVVDVGGGTSEVTAFCFGGVVAHKTSRTAGDEMTLAVVEYLRQVHLLDVSELAAEEAKIAASQDDESSLIIEGRDAVTGHSRAVTVEVEEISEAVRPVVHGIIGTLGETLADLPPESVSDVAERGVLAIGGGSMFRGFDKMLEKELGFPVRRAARPLTCVAEGAAAIWRRPDLQRVALDD